jgi:hypothetical protein
VGDAHPGRERAQVIAGVDEDDLAVIGVKGHVFDAVTAVG